MAYSPLRCSLKLTLQIHAFHTAHQCNHRGKNRCYPAQPANWPIIRMGWVKTHMTIKANHRNRSKISIQFRSDQASLFSGRTGEDKLNMGWAAYLKALSADPSEATVSGLLHPCRPADWQKNPCCPAVTMEGA